jgi:hypothetical protein
MGRDDDLAGVVDDVPALPANAQSFPEEPFLASFRRVV